MNGVGNKARADAVNLELVTATERRFPDWRTANQFESDTNYISFEKRIFNRNYAHVPASVALQPFTLPLVKPLMMRCWKTKMMTTTGMIATMIAALTTSHWNPPNCD